MNMANIQQNIRMQKKSGNDLNEIKQVNEVCCNKVRHKTMKKSKKECCDEKWTSFLLQANIFAK